MPRDLAGNSTGWERRTRNRIETAMQYGLTRLPSAKRCPIPTPFGHARPEPNITDNKSLDRCTQARVGESHDKQELGTGDTHEMEVISMNFQWSYLWQQMRSDELGPCCPTTAD